MYAQSDQVIALAGIFQAAHLAYHIAHHGMADSVPMESSIHSLFQVDADSVAGVFGGLPGVATGLRQLSSQLSGKTGRDVELTRYVISLIELEGKMSRSADMISTIRSGIEETQGKLSQFPLLHRNILARLADIYSQTISTLQPRIMVHGEPLHLQNPDNVNKIRALLLAGIRAAMLWRQTGGKRVHIIFGRRKQLNKVRELLEDIESDRP